MQRAWKVNKVDRISSKRSRRSTGEISSSFSYNRCEFAIFRVNHRMMKGMRALNINRSLLGWVMAPLFLCLIVMGARVPSLNGPQSPKPRPRAIIESSFKNSEDATVKQSAMAAEICGAQPSLLPPREYRLAFREESFSFFSISSPQSDARAPPTLTC
jgi:hypothetical protein